MLFWRNHTLTYKIVTSTDAHEDENGDWHPGTSTETIVELECRSEPNGTSETIISEDGQKIVFSRVAYLNLEIDDIPFGKEVSIFKNGKLLTKDTVKLFERDQKKCRLWV